MKTLFITLLLALASYFFGQTPYETDMNSAMQNWKSAKTQADYNAVSTAFEKIASSQPKNWEPRYYALLVKTVSSFELPKEQAFEQIKEVENNFNLLTEINNNDETKVLHALFLTVKVAKDPMTYGPMLSQEIVSIYNQALKENPKNPRALFHLAEYQMNSAPYYGKDPKDFCPDIQLSLVLFENEKTDGYSPHWGQQRAQQLWDEKCQ